MHCIDAGRGLKDELGPSVARDPHRPIDRTAHHCAAYVGECDGAHRRAVINRAEPASAWKLVDLYGSATCDGSEATIRGDSRRRRGEPATLDQRDGWQLGEQPFAR